MVLAVLLELTGAARRQPGPARRKARQADGAVTDRVPCRCPDGLDGMRLDQAVSRLFGLSRTAAADPGRGRRRAGRRHPAAQVRQGHRRLLARGHAAAAGHRADASVAEPVHGLTVVYSDDDIVVVDKPVGVAAHPSPGWTGPTVIGGLAAMGQNVATSGAAERQGVVHRLDVGTTGLMVVAKSELAYSALKRAFKEREVDKRYHAVVQGHLDPLRGTIDAPIDRHPTADYR